MPTFWNKKPSGAAPTERTRSEIIDTAGAAIATTRTIDGKQRAPIVLYGEPWLQVAWGTTVMPYRAPCDVCDVVDITAHGDAYRRFQCVNCERISVTNEPNIAATGATQRLDMRACAQCGEETPIAGLFCINCGSREVG